VTAISAHRDGGERAPEGTYDAYRTALATGAEYVHIPYLSQACGPRSYSVPPAPVRP
jgi:hypothetical protein